MPCRMLLLLCWILVVSVLHVWLRSRPQMVVLGLDENGNKLSSDSN